MEDFGGPGNTRKKVNQDYVIKDTRNHFFAVADGVGGLQYSEEASMLAATHFHYLVKRHITGFDGENINELDKDFVNDFAGQYLNQSIDLINNLSKPSESRLHLFGTTLSAVILGNNFVSVVSVGDSPVYRFRENKLELLSVYDHDLSAFKGKSNIISRREANLSQYIGLGGKLDIHVNSDVLKNQDILVLMTDCATKYLTDNELSTIINESKFEDIPANIFKATKNPDELILEYAKDKVIGYNEAKEKIMSEKGDDFSLVALMAVRN